LSRFPEVANLVFVSWLEIRGVLNTRILSPDTQYAAYFVYKMEDAPGFRNRIVELSVGFDGDHDSTKNVCLHPIEEGSSNEERVAGLQRPSVRSDGWLEIEMGELSNIGLENEVQMSVMEVKGGNWKSDLCVEGIEVRPNYEN